MKPEELSEKVRILILKLAETLKANNCNAVLGIYINDNEANLYYTDVIAQADDDDVKTAIFEWVRILNEQKVETEAGDDEGLAL